MLHTTALLAFVVAGTSGTDDGQDDSDYWVTDQPLVQLALFQEDLSPDSEEPSEPESAEEADAAEGQPVAQPLGRPPPDYSRNVVRSSSVLLAPGEWQLEYGFSYSFFEDETVVLLPGGFLIDEILRDRQLVVPLAVRYGLTPRVQASVFLPVGMTHTELLDPFGDEETTLGAIGDISTGFNYTSNGLDLRFRERLEIQCE